MEDLKTGSSPIKYSKDYRGDMYIDEQGKWVKAEDAQEMLDWLRVFIHMTEKGVAPGSLVGFSLVVKNRLKSITK
jgi:hypothetical protein